MSAPIELIPLRCPECQFHVPAEPDEVAWVCPNCHTSLILDENIGLKRFEIKYSDRVQSGKQGRPFWVARAQVDISRKVYESACGAKKDAKEFWEQPRTFYIPAFTCDLDKMIEISAHLVTNPVPLKPGARVPFLPITLEQEDVHAYAEFTVLGIEAHRKDKVSKVHFDLHLQNLALWILP